VKLPLTLTHTASDPVDAKLYIEAEGIPRREVPITSQSRGLLTSPDGATSQIFFDSTSPRAFGLRNGMVTLEVEIKDRFGGTAKARASLEIRNDNQPSAILIGLGTPNKPIRGRVPVTFTIIDPEGGTADVAVEFSVDGGQTFRDATGLYLGQGPRSFAQPLKNRRTGVFPDLGTGRTQFLWDTNADIGVAPPLGRPFFLESRRRARESDLPRQRRRSFRTTSTSRVTRSRHPCRPAPPVSLSPSLSLTGTATGSPTWPSSVSQVSPSGSTHAALHASPGDGFVDVGPLDVTAAVGSASSFKLRFRLVSDTERNEDRGWYLDDLEVALEAR
jgi:hypothetical protein